MSRPPRRRIKITHVEFPSNAKMTKTEGPGFQMVHVEGPMHSNELLDLIHGTQVKIIDHEPKEAKKP